MKLDTTILISKSTREQLRNISRKGQTYDETILKLLERSELVKNNSMTSDLPSAEVITVPIIGVQ